MSIFKRKIPISERRQYLRLDTILPVEFKLVGIKDGLEKSSWLQGFSSNVGKGGLSLSTYDLDSKYADLILGKEVKFLLKIDLPFTRYYAQASAEIIWVQSEEEDFFRRYLIGLRYEVIDAKVNQRIMRFAHLRRIVPRMLITASALLLLGFLFNSFIGIALFKINKSLTNQLVDIVQRSSITKQDMNKIFGQKDDLILRLSENKIRIDNVAMIPDNVKRSELHKALIKERESLEKAFNALDKKGVAITEGLLYMDRASVDPEAANLGKIYKCIEANQAPSTGLIASFIEGRQFEGIAFTYDQATVIFTLAYLSDYSQAANILDFYKYRARKLRGYFVNAYYVSEGTVANYSLSQATNIALGIAVLQYTLRANDRSYLDLAEGIAKQVMNSKEMQTGQLKLDAYAFFSTLHKVTGKDAYRKASDDIFKKWKSGFHLGDELSFEDHALPILVLGPGRLFVDGINPDNLVRTIEKKFGVTPVFSNAHGFGNGGIISCEWTGQMALVYGAMAEYYANQQIPAKSKAFRDRANECLSEMANLIVTDQIDHRQGCVYYSKSDYVDTGHGFRTPKGKKPASLAATSLTLCAYYGYNPYRIEE